MLQLFLQLLKYIPGMYMGWGLGANDGANIFGTAVSSRVITFRNAVIITGVFVFAGALIQGPGVMELFTQLSRITPREAAIAALCAAMTIHAMTWLAIPASTSQAIVGAVIGLGILQGTADFSSLRVVVLCWLLTPVGATLISFTIYGLLKVFGERRIRSMVDFERFIRLAIILSGCYGAYALGANNVANVTGVYYASGLLLPLPAAALGGVAIAIGTVTYSKRVMVTVGERITSLDPLTAFISVLSVALTVHIFAFVGVPVSSSQAIVGAVVGIGLVKGTKSVSRRTVLLVGLGWVFTPFVAGILSVAMLLGAALILRG